ncbi:hypothetical protein [Chryseobacterium wanjuense]
MKATVLKKHGGTDQSSLVDLLSPQPAKNEVLIWVHAIGIYPTDIYVRQNIGLDYIFNW